MGSYSTVPYIIIGILSYDSPISTALSAQTYTILFGRHYENISNNWKFKKKTHLSNSKKIEGYHKEYSDFKYEYLFLKDIDFKLCKGCFVCISHGEDKCPLQDDRDLIINKIESSDGVILASPNYVMNVSWLMKNFIDLHIQCTDQNSLIKSL